MDLVYRFEADLTELVPVGLVPEGIRLDAYFSGQVVEGPLSGATLRRIDYVLLRFDGVGVVDAYELISTAADQHVSTHAQGYITPPPEMQLPPPEELLSPEFRWPNVPLLTHGFVLGRTGAEDLAWMNRTALAFEGTVNMGTRKLVIETWALKSGASERPGVGLSPEERHQVVEQGQAMLEQFYVHLPLKRAIHAIEPIQRLRLLNYRLDHMSERQFYDEMISIFMGVQDLHTNFILPPPFQGTRVSLPVFIEEFFEGDERKYIVSQVTANLGDPLFKPGVVITHWNGILIDRAVELNARRQGGSNPPAAHARGLNALTARTLGLAQPPDEEWVVLGYVADGQDREIRLNWQVVVPPPSPTAVDPNSLEDPASRALGIDIQTEDIRRARKMLFVPEAMELEQQDSATLEASGVSTFPDKLEFRTVSTPHGDFGYIRIRSFNVQESEPFVDEVTRILGLLPKNGLIVDVRSNGGGNILAGERLLQLFTPRTIEPELMSLINTPATLELCKRTSWLAPWKESIEQAVETAAVHSDGFPIVPEEAEACNRRGQQYYGPVLLITNALCYSTTDMFAAGWQDHEIGPILGTDRNTGAGGANVFTHVFLQQLLPDKVKPLPKRTSFRVAIRRATRVGKRSGTLLEELGVVPDEFHSMTKNDVLKQNEDLIARAASILAGLPVRALDVGLRFAEAGGPVEKGNVQVSATVQNISRLDAYVDGRPRSSIDVQDEATTQVFDVLVGEPGFHTLELRGFYDDELVAVKRMEVQIEV